MVKREVGLQSHSFRNDVFNTEVPLLGLFLCLFVFGLQKQPFYADQTFI